MPGLWASSTSQNCSSIRSTGFKAFMADGHHARLAPAVAAQPLVVKTEDVLPLEQDLAAADIGGRLVQPGHREGDRGLAAAGLAGEAEDFAWAMSKLTELTARTSPLSVM